MYKHLYLLFGNFTLAETNYIKLEKIRRAVVRKVYYFAWHDNEWNVQEIQHRQYQRRAIKFTEKYIYKDDHSKIIIIIIIKEIIDECNILSALDESLFSSSEKIETIHGTLKAHKMNFNSLLNATTQLEQHGHLSTNIYQQHDELVLLFL